MSESIGFPVVGSLKRAHVRPVGMFPYTVRSISVPPQRRRIVAPPFGREFVDRPNTRYSLPLPHAPTVWVNVYSVFQLFPCRRSRTQPLRLRGDAVGFAISTHSGFGAGETSLITTSVPPGLNGAGGALAERVEKE